MNFCQFQYYRLLYFLLYIFTIQFDIDRQNRISSCFVFTFLYTIFSDNNQLTIEATITEDQKLAVIVTLKPGEIVNVIKYETISSFKIKIPLQETKKLDQSVSNQQSKEYETQPEKSTRNKMDELRDYIKSCEHVYHFKNQKVTKKEQKIRKQLPNASLLSIAEQWIDPQCYDYENLIFKDNTIVVDSNKNSNGVQVFGNRILSNKNCVFNIKLQNIDNCTAIGIYDALYTKQKYKNRLIQPVNQIYYGGIGQILNKSVNCFKNQLLKNNKVITVRVDFEKGVVTWEWDGAVKGIAKNQVLLDETIKWVPYVWLSPGSIMTIVD